MPSSEPVTVMGFKCREFELPIKVDVYRNLQTEAMSVKAREGEHEGLVIAHRESVVLEDAEFVVREKGWKDVHISGCKNVHAVVRGTLVRFNDTENGGQPTDLTYNPMKYRYFVTRENEKPVDSADEVRVQTPGQIEAWGVDLKDANPDPSAHLETIEPMEAD